MTSQFVYKGEVKNLKASALKPKALANMFQLELNSLVLIDAEGVCYTVENDCFDIPLPDDAKFEIQGKSISEIVKNQTELSNRSIISQRQLMSSTPSIISQCQLISKCNNGGPTWYSLPKSVKSINEKLRLKTVHVGSETEESKRKPRKVVLMVGATGAGKTTLINGMVNFLYGVKKEDSFRLQLIPKESNESQANSQTSDVTQYILHWNKDSAVNYNIVFIDTPGYGDTRGIAQDGELVKQLRVFFNTAVDHIDAVGFVIQSALPRLTKTQEYIFDGILSLFGKDIQKNVFLMLTFTDGSKPPVLEAVKKFGIKYEDYFKFNNSVFTIETNQEDEINDQEKQIIGMYWDMAYMAYNSFFNKLNHVHAKSLILTREVLEERRSLETNIEILSLKIKDGVNQLAIMREELPFIMEFEAEKHANKNYSRTIKVPKTRKVTFHDGHFVTNCAVCSQTCHDNCAYFKDEDKVKCVAMNTTGYCKVCRKSCHWGKHYHCNHYFKEYEESETINIEDMKRKYTEANSQLSLKENLLIGIVKEYNETQKMVLKAVDLIRKCLERLSEIAMRPDPLSAVEYIDMLIEATKHEKRPGWKQRILQLENARGRALLIKNMNAHGKQYDPFAEKIQELKSALAEREQKIKKGISTDGEFISKIKGCVRNIFQLKF